MRVDENALARVYSFDLKFKGGKRTQFYRKLFGFKSKSTRQDQEGRERVYENFYPGVLTPLPHLRLGKSVFAVPKSAAGEIDSFFEDDRWGQIELFPFDGILPSEDRMEAMEEAMERIKVAQERTLRSELDALRRLEEGGGLGPGDATRVRLVVKRVRELMEHDWTDDREFSKGVEEDIMALESRI